MRYYVEESLRFFKFWSGGKDTADALTYEQIDRIESMMEDCEPAEGWSDTAINDFFWFERDTIAEWLGYRNAEAMLSDDELDWEDHYNELLQEKFPGEDEDLIEEFVRDEVFDNTDDKEVIEDFKKWLAEREEEAMQNKIKI